MFSTIHRIVRASYPALWPYTGFLFILGILIGLKNGGSLSPALIPYVLWFFIGANLFGMLLNDYFDQTLDAHNPRKTQLKLSTHEYILGIAVALISYCAIAALFPNLPIFVWVVVAIVANAAYSIRPLRFKERPPFDLLVGPASYFSALCAGYGLVAGWPTPIAIMAGILFFCGIDLAFKTLDIEADTQENMHSSAVLLGRSYALAGSVILILGSGALLAQVNQYYVFATLPYLYIVYTLRNTNDISSRNILNERLPIYYAVAGFIVTFLYWNLG